MTWTVLPAAELGGGRVCDGPSTAARLLTGDYAELSERCAGLTGAGVQERSWKARGKGPSLRPTGALIDVRASPGFDGPEIFFSSYF